MGLADASTYVQLIDRMPHLGPVSKFADSMFRDWDGQRISRPLLFFASADDPFHPIGDVGIDPDLQHVLYYITAVGGHVAWPEGWSADCSSFQTRVVLGFL